MKSQTRPGDKGGCYGIEAGDYGQAADKTTRLEDAEYGERRRKVCVGHSGSLTEEKTMRIRPFGESDRPP